MVNHLSFLPLNRTTHCVMALQFCARSLSAPHLLPRAPPLQSRGPAPTLFPMLSSPNFRIIQAPSRGHLQSRIARFASSSDVAEQTIHDFTVQDIDGNDVSLSTFKGMVLLIINVASRCGLTTSNYRELSELYSKLKDKGFEILAFPCNQFGGQEPGTNEQIKEFACSRFKAEYPIFDKIDVNGENAAPVYKFLKSGKSAGFFGSLLGDSIKWNFEKFLIDKNGQVVRRYGPTTSPLQIENDIKKLLEA